MAKFDMIANHKKGFINSTVGNAFRGGLLGTAVFGGIAALATLATGGLALPVVAMAAAGGAALFGTLNAAGGAARWGVETIGGIIGINRPNRGPQVDEYGYEQQQQRGPGLAEALVTAVGAVMGFKTMKDKFSGMFGGKDNEVTPNAPAFQAQRGGDRFAPSVMKPPQMPSILAEFMKEGQLELSKDQLADPNIRGALQSFGEQQVAYRDSLVNSGRRDLMQQARDMNNKALEYPGYKKETETFVINPEHAMDSKIVRHMNRDGERRQKENAREMNSEIRDLQRESADISRGRYGVQFASEPKREEAPTQEKDAPAQEKPAVERHSQIHAEASNAPDNEMPISKEVQQNAGKEPPKKAAEAGAPKREEPKSEAQGGYKDTAARIAQEMKKRGVVHEGASQKAQAGATTAKAPSQRQGIGQGG